MLLRERVTTDGAGARRTGADTGGEGAAAGTEGSTDDPGGDPAREGVVSGASVGDPARCGTLEAALSGTEWAGEGGSPVWRSGLSELAEVGVVGRAAVEGGEAVAEQSSELPETEELGIGP